MDLLAIAALINGVAAWLLVRLARRPVARTAALSLAILWSGAELAGLGVLGREAFTVWLPAKLDSSRAEEENVRAFLVSDRPEELLDKPPMTVPFPDARSLIGWLRDPTLRRTLPAVVRDPLRLEHAETTGAFTLNALPPALRERDARLHPIPPAWGSFGPLGGGDQGQLKAGLQAPGEGERAVLPYLRVQFAGDLGRAGESGQGLALRIESATAGDRPVTSVLRPARVPGERWRTEYLRTPGDGRKGLRLSVEDRSAESWLALRAPVEVGALSYWAGWLLRHSEPVFWAGALGLAAYGSARTFREWRESAKISREPRAATLPAAP